MKLYIILLSTSLLYSCAWPKSSQEFMDAMGDGKKSTVNKSLEYVASKNTKLFIKCFNAHVKVSTINGSSGGENISFIPKVTKNNKSVVFSLQQSGTAHINTGYPDDGMFIFTAKIESLAKNKTQITTHVMWNHGNLETAFHKWSNGQSSECPNLI